MSSYKRIILSLFFKKYELIQFKKHSEFFIYLFFTSSFQFESPHNCIEMSGQYNYSKCLLLCFHRKKEEERLMVLERHESEQMITDLSFLCELIL